MRHGIVEGEPGIYPDPFARVMRAIGRLFSHRARRAPDDQESPPPPGSPPDDPAPEQPSA
ncbi:MAG: hypothetical protein ACR2GF_04330 [Acidimicrobiales bacterium]